MVTIIIPTTCEKHRSVQLDRAIDSVLSQNIKGLQCVVVANGRRIDLGTLNKLKKDERLQVLEQEIGSLPLALQNGRKNVSSEFFAVLDDDDELLPGSLQARLDSILMDDKLAAVVSDGYVSVNGKKHAFLDINAVSNDPLVSLLHSNWLTSCGALYRTCLVPADYFAAQYYEWTYVAFRLALEHKIKFIEHKGFIVNQDTPGSLSKSAEYSDQYPKFIKGLLTLPAPPRVQRILKRKLGNALHCEAERLRTEAHMASAWRSHCESLICKEGWKYVLYTRKLIASSIRKISGL